MQLVPGKRVYESIDYQILSKDVLNESGEIQIENTLDQQCSLSWMSRPFQPQQPLQGSVHNETNVLEQAFVKFRIHEIRV